MAKTAWWDIDKRGRRWEAIMKQLEKKFWIAFKEGNMSLAESYERRMTIIEKTISPYLLIPPDSVNWRFAHTEVFIYYGCI